jgi:mannobiose 2-epimerase
MIQPEELQKFSTEIDAHLFRHILPFWAGPALDHQNGGWMAWLSHDLKPDRSQPKGLVVNARILWAFSAAYRARPEAIYKEMAERAFEFVTTKFRDARHGGAFWQLNDAGAVIDDSKKIYGQAFYIYALSEFHRAFGNHAALAGAMELFELIERHAHDAKYGGYIEVCRRDWSEAGPEARLSEKDLAEKKSMNNHLHVLEAYTNLYRVWREPRVGEQLHELMDLFVTRILDSKTKHLHHFFNERWDVRSDSYTFGHDIEASWLLCETAEELGDIQLLKRVRGVALEMAETVFDEGLGADGSLCYEGRAGHIIDPGRECWPHAEAMVGFLNAYQIARDSKFLAAALSVWKYIEINFIDRVHGEWFWRVNRDGTVDSALPKVSEWKGPYHATRACLEVKRRIASLTK